jgi:HK97 gp10 family phage protein
VIDFSVTASVGPALRTLEQSARKAAKGLATGTKHAASIIRKNAVDSMPQGNRANRSKPGEPPFKQSGRLARSLRFDGTSDGGAAILSNRRTREGFVARLMENGTAKMKPRPFIRPAVNKALPRLPVLMKTEIVRAF